MNYTIYNLTTGQITGTISTGDSELAQQNLQNLDYIIGNFNAKQYYIENEQAIAKPVKPIDHPFYVFDYSDKNWKVDIDSMQRQMRSLRDEMLSQVDRVNPVRYATLTTQQQTELAAYRQALLDVPQQASFPTDVSWPAKPAWL
jgi:hypothetical protein